MKVVSSFKYKVRNVKPLPENLKDDFVPMNLDDPEFIRQGLEYLASVKQKMAKGIITGEIVGVTYERRD